MKKYILLIFGAVLFNLSASAQAIVRAEYFFNVDNGVGTGTNLPLSNSGDSVTLSNATISTAGLAIGKHTLFVRVQSANGKWSVTEQRQFVIQHIPQQEIAAGIDKAEYFFDTDNGVGTGTNLPLSNSGDSITLSNATISMSGLTTGKHTLFVRTRAANGKWSVTEKRQFVIQHAPLYSENSPIVAAEMFFNTEVGITNGTPLDITAGDSITLNKTIDLACFPKGSYRAYIRVVNADGGWSVTETADFYVAGTDIKLDAITVTSDCVSKTINVRIKNLSNLPFSTRGSFAKLTMSGANSGIFYTNPDATIVPPNGTAWLKGTGFNFFNDGTMNIAAELSQVCNDTVNTNDNYNVSLNQIQVLVAPKIFLQGAYNTATGMMNDGLRSANLLPEFEPYTFLGGFTHACTGGNEGGFPMVYNTTGADAVVDWVFLELTKADNPTVVVSTKAAFIQRDGDVKEADNVSPVAFKHVDAGSYYLTVRHRNHLSVRTANPISLNGTTPTVVDFTNNLNTVYKNLSVQNAAMATVAPNIYALWAGDVNGDGLVKMTGYKPENNDYLKLRAKLNGMTTTPNAYQKEDLNLDGVVKMTDTSNDYQFLLNVLGMPSQVIQKQF